MPHIEIETPEKDLERENSEKDLIKMECQDDILDDLDDKDSIE